MNIYRTQVLKMHNFLQLNLNVCAIEILLKLIKVEKKHSFSKIQSAKKGPFYMLVLK